MEESEGYPFVFQMIDRDSADEWLIETLLVRISFLLFPYFLFLFWSNSGYFKAFALTGRLADCHYTQGDALGGH